MSAQLQYMAVEAAATAVPLAAYVGFTQSTRSAGWAFAEAAGVSILAQMAAKSMKKEGDPITLALLSGGMIGGYNYFNYKNAEEALKIGGIAAIAAYVGREIVLPPVLSFMLRERISSVVGGLASANN